LNEHQKEIRCRATADNHAASNPSQTRSQANGSYVHPPFTHILHPGVLCAEGPQMVGS
jgi:hypothetical protein